MAAANLELFAEATARRNLAALYRLSVLFGWTDLTSTHISSRIADDPDHFLMNSYEVMFDRIQPDYKN